MIAYLFFQAAFLAFVGVMVNHRSPMGAIVCVGAWVFAVANLFIMARTAFPELNWGF